MSNINNMDIKKKNINRRLKPGLPQFQRGNVTSFVEQTVLAEIIKNVKFNFDQYTSLLAIRNLIAACICYLIDIRGEDKDWEDVYWMLECCMDEAHQIPADNPLDAVFEEASGDDRRCYCWTLYESALIGGSYHIPSTFGKALRILAEYIFC